MVKMDAGTEEKRQWVGVSCCQWWAISASSSPFSSFTRVRALNICRAICVSERRSALPAANSSSDDSRARAGCAAPAEAAAEMRDQHLADGSLIADQLHQLIDAILLKEIFGTLLLQGEAGIEKG